MSYAAATAQQFAPWQAAFQAMPSNAWKPDVCNRIEDRPWLQIDIGGHYKVTGYLIQGCRSSEAWVTSFLISYSNDGVNWNFVKDLNDSSEEMIFNGNLNERSIVYCSLVSYNIVARFLRMHVLSAHNNLPCVHADFTRGLEWQGCPELKITGSENFNAGGSASPGETVTVKCRQGLQTINRERSYQLTCGDNLQWQGAFQECLGKNNLIFYL